MAIAMDASVYSGIGSVGLYVDNIFHSYFVSFCLYSYALYL